MDEVTVVDPACGSGAYLLGMMQELIELQTALYNVGVDERSLYELKLHIIERNLYGVDIDEFAVNIAMLRLWLSLAIDFEGDSPPPLPNLDFKIVCGDSLLGPDPSPSSEVQFTLGQDIELMNQLGESKSEYMRSSIGTNKERLKIEIRGVEEQVKDALGKANVHEGVVDWRVSFAEVFAVNNGFDIAVANPPYVRQEEIEPPSYKDTLFALYSTAVTKRSDLYCYFYARALQLLRLGGVQVFVCSNSWLDVGYGAKLQEFLLVNTHVLSIHESAVERQFSTAQINTIISVIVRGASADDTETRFISLRAEFERALADRSQRREISMSRKDLLDAGRDPKTGKMIGDKWGGKYLRAPDIYHHIFAKHVSKLVRLGDVATIKRGITTGANDFFFLTKERIDQWDIEEYYREPAMTSPRESRSIAVDADSLPKQVFLCHGDKERMQGTASLEYIRWGEAQGYHTRRSMESRNNWYDLGPRDTSHLAMNYLINTTARIFSSAPGLYFGDNFQEIHSTTCRAIKICAVMNATLTQLMFNIAGRANFGGGLLKIQTFEIENLVLVDPHMMPEIDISDFHSTEWDVLKPSAERCNIDDAVYDILQLTHD